MDSINGISGDTHSPAEGEPTQQANAEDGNTLVTWRSEHEDARSSQPIHRTWDQELPRWRATLNPGRTGHEYEKALRYFFETPGVPQRLTELTFDLLLAYRGALALRAASRDRPEAPQRPAGAPRFFDAQLGAAWTAALPEHDAGAAAGDGSRERLRHSGSGLLAPATVNIRLTALRQFLVHCASLGLLPSLTPDRIRSALRRLSIERRRPYQILAEHEWASFLQAALAPARDVIKPAAPPTESSSDFPRGKTRPGPWGLSRAERAEARASGRRQGDPKSEATSDRTPGAPKTSSSLSRSRGGLTGARTAQRDHALLSLALATGLRAIELISLDVGDLVREWHEGREEWWLVLPDAKTKGQHGGRTLPLAPSLVETLLAYVQATGRRWEQGGDRKTPLFLSHHVGRSDERSASGATTPKSTRSVAGERRLSTTQVREIVDRVEAQWLAARDDAPIGSGIAGESRAISPHALRHSTALALLEGDGVARPPASVEHVRGWLGHFDIRTTQGYLAHLDARKHRRPFTIDPGRDENRRDTVEGEQ